MPRTWKPIRRALGAPLSALVLLTSAVGPLLDGIDAHGGDVMECAGTQTAAGQHHDHRLCLQVGANQPLPSHDELRPVLWPARAAAAPAERHAAPACGERVGPSARAPPSPSR